MSEDTAIERFRTSLANSRQEFIYIGEPADGCSRIRFTGTFQGTPVVWDATIMTVAYYNARQARNNRPAAYRQFIDIGHSDNTLRVIEIGLELEEIDAAVLQKTIVMVRNYKRLHVGRHWFGGTGRRK